MAFWLLSWACRVVVNVNVTQTGPTACLTDAACTGVEGLAGKPIANEKCPATAACEFGDAGDSMTWVVLVLFLIVAGVATVKYWPLIVTKIPADLAAKLPKAGTMTHSTARSNVFAARSCSSSSF